MCPLLGHALVFLALGVLEMPPGPIVPVAGGRTGTAQQPVPRPSPVMTTDTAGDQDLARFRDRRLLLGDFGPRWRGRWPRKRLTPGRNRYRVVDESGNRVLEVRSHRAAEGRYCELDIKPVAAGQLSWRWKVEHSLAGTLREASLRETQKPGDDYAARVFVVFESHLLPWKTRALCYVWAGNQPAGSVYASPYSGTVGIFVLRSGEAETGRWVHEERDIVVDYRTFFGREPEQISAVAIMVDTDNTNARAMAWFDDLVLALLPVALSEVSP